MSQDTHLRPTDVPSPDTILRNRRRRHALAALSGRDAPVSLRTLAAAVAARESGTDPDAVPAGTAEAVGVALHHAHLPKLADASVVDYDARTHTVVPLRVERFTSLLDDAARGSDDSSGA